MYVFPPGSTSRIGTFLPRAKTESNQHSDDLVTATYNSYTCNVATWCAALVANGELRCNIVHYTATCRGALQHGALRCSMEHCVAAWSTVLQHRALCCNVCAPDLGSRGVVGQQRDVDVPELVELVAQQLQANKPTNKLSEILTTKRRRERGPRPTRCTQSALADSTLLVQRCVTARTRACSPSQQLTPLTTLRDYWRITLHAARSARWALHVARCMLHGAGLRRPTAARSAACSGPSRAWTSRTAGTQPSMQPTQRATNAACTGHVAYNGQHSTWLTWPQRHGGGY
jgi:hypothetical protein